MILITVCRTLFYQFFLLFVGLSVGFLLNVEYVGWKYPIVHNSIYNTFFPIDFEEEGVLDCLYNQGRFKISAFNGYPKDFEVIEEAMCAEEWYWVKYSYTDNNGNTRIAIDHVRIRWKPWEYYYENGQLTFKGDYTAGKEDGVFEYFKEDGSFEKKETWKNGTLIFA